MTSATSVTARATGLEIVLMIDMADAGRHVFCFLCIELLAGFPRSWKIWKILEKIVVMESHGKVLEYENFPKSHGKVMEFLLLMGLWQLSSL